MIILVLFENIKIVIILCIQYYDHTMMKSWEKSIYFNLISGRDTNLKKMDEYDFTLSL